MEKQSSPPPASFKVTAPKVTAFVALILVLFWISACEIYGVLYDSSQHSYLANVAVADFDGGSIGKALLTLIQNATTENYPTFEVFDPTTTSPDDLRQLVYNGHYYAAVFATTGATDRWTTAINGTATSYDATNTIIWYDTPARFYVFYQSLVYAPLAGLLPRVSAVFEQQTSGPLLAQQGWSRTSMTAISALFQPISVKEVTLASLTFGAKGLVNTVTVALQVLPQFFFVMGCAEILAPFAKAWTPLRNMAMRWLIFVGFTFLTSLSTTGWLAIFRESQDELGGTFVGIWGVCWLFALIMVFFLDTMHAVVPLQFLSFVFSAFTFFNVAASLCDPDLSNSWYKTVYAFPGHHWAVCILVLITHGAFKSWLKWALPSLFLMLLVGQAMWWLARLRFFSRQKQQSGALDMPNAVDVNAKQSEGPNSPKQDDGKSADAVQKW